MTTSQTYQKSKTSTDSWATPAELKATLHKEFKFDDFDPCPLCDNPKVDGLGLDWANRTFVNPPYSALKTTKKHGLGWVEKAHNEARKGKLVVLLIPARTDTTWFHDIILKNGYEVRFVRGRLSFGDGGGSAPFPSIYVIMDGTSRGAIKRGLWEESLLAPIPDELCVASGVKKTVRVLELFAGTGSVGKVCKKRGWEVVSLDISKKYNPDLDIVADITKWDYKNSGYKPGYFDIIWASPPCQTFSHLRQIGLGQNIKDTMTPEAFKKWKAKKIKRDIKKIGLPPLNASKEIIDYFKPNHYFIENPQTGKMKDYIGGLPYTDGDYCMYSDWGYRKRTRFWNNSGCKLKKCNKACGNIENGKHTAQIGFTKMTLQQRYAIPPKLITSLLDQLPL